MNVNLNLAVTLTNLKVIRVKRATAPDRKLRKMTTFVVHGGG